MKDKKTILGEIKDILFGAEKVEKFLDAKSGDFILRVDGEDFVEGASISLVTPDGLIPAEDGVYPLEDGRELYIVSGKVDKIEVASEAPEAEAAEAPEVAVELAEVDLLDGKKLSIDGDVAVGNKVSLDGEQAAEGQYDLADGRVIYVDAEGLINEIQTPDTKKVDEVGLEAVVEAPAYVDETAGMTASVTNDEMMARLVKCEEMIAEMMGAQKEMANFSKMVEDKIDTFVKDTPAELEFKSVKSELNSMLAENKTKAESNLEAIRNLRAKK